MICVYDALCQLCKFSMFFETPFFTGKERDAESGNDYFGARYYASTMGRFLSPDWSAKIEPVPYAKLDNPQSLNLYAYVQNNPLARFDPDGHRWVFTGNENVSDKQLKKAFEAGVKAQGAGAWKAYQAIGKATGDVNVGFGDLKTKDGKSNPNQFGDTNFSFKSSGGKLTEVSGSITFNTNPQAMNIGSFTDLASASSHEFTHVEGVLASPGANLSGGLGNLAPNARSAQEMAAFRNQARAAFVVGAIPGNTPITSGTALSWGVERSVGKTDDQMRDVLSEAGYKF
jgi:RHS repeat-associated protein